jgi:hypothetical protein
MGKDTLAGLLGAQKDVAREAQLRTKEGARLFAQKEAFVGLTSRYTPYSDEDRDIPALDQKKRVTSVPERLRYEAGFLLALLELVITREVTNTQATGDLLLPDGSTVEGIPVGVLMELPKHLRELRAELATVPTLDNTREWTPSQNEEHVFVAEDVPSVRSVKKLRHKVIVQPTPEHPAHVAEYTDVVPVGETIRRHTSGAITSTQKAQMLRRLDFILTELEKARGAANATQPDRSQAGLAKTILTQVLGDIMSLPDPTEVKPPAD